MRRVDAVAATAVVLAHSLDSRLVHCGSKVRGYRATAVSQTTAEDAIVQAGRA